MSANQLVTQGGRSNPWSAFSFFPQQSANRIERNLCIAQPRKAFGRALLRIGNTTRGD
jgi:hypothetical protein